MYYITKIFHVPVGHRLSLHKGKCFNVHGHNLTIEVTLASRLLNKNDMVMDFSDLSSIVKRFLDELDHALILNKKDPFIETFKGICKIRTIDGEPTAENLSRMLFKTLEKEMYTHPTASVESVTIWENESSKATYKK